MMMNKMFEAWQPSARQYASGRTLTVLPPKGVPGLFATVICGGPFLSMAVTSTIKVPRYVSPVALTIKHLCPKQLQK